MTPIDSEDELRAFENWLIDTLCEWTDFNPDGQIGMILSSKLSDIRNNFQRQRNQGAKLMPTLSSVPEEKSIDKIIKTKYELALASEPTEDGKKAIERFYSLFLNNWPGFDALIKSQTNQAVLEALDRVEKEVIGAIEPSYDTENPWEADKRHGANILRSQQRKKLATLRKELTQEVQTDE